MKDIRKLNPKADWKEQSKVLFGFSDEQIAELSAMVDEISDEKQQQKKEK